MREKHFISIWQMWNPQAGVLRLPTAVDRSTALSCAVRPLPSLGTLLSPLMAAFAVITAEGKGKEDA